MWEIHCWTLGSVMYTYDQQARRQGGGGGSSLSPPFGYYNNACLSAHKLSWITHELLCLTLTIIIATLQETPYIQSVKHKTVTDSGAEGIPKLKPRSCALLSLQLCYCPGLYMWPTVSSCHITQGVQNFKKECPSCWRENHKTVRYQCWCLDCTYEAFLDLWELW